MKTDEKLPKDAHRMLNEDRIFCRFIRAVMRNEEIGQKEIQTDMPSLLPNSSK